MKRVLFASLAAAALAVPAPLPAQDGGGGGAPPAPPAGAPAAPAPAAKQPPKDPPRPVADRIHESLKTLFAGSGATRLSAQALLEGAVAEWAADAKEDPLKAVKWWRTALQGTLPAAAPRTGIEEKKLPYTEGKEFRVWVSVPKGYTAKSTYPLLLVILDRDEEARRALPAMYGDLLKEFLVVAIPGDAKAAGFDVAKEPWLAAVGLRHAIETYRVDRDRVVLDGSHGAANLVHSLGSEWAIHFAGCVLRGPFEANPLASNLSLCATAAVAAGPATEPQKKALEALKAAAPEATVIADPKGAAEALQKWIAAVPPRRITRPDTASFTWKARPQAEPWAYWLWVFRAADPKKERLVTLTLKRDAGAGTVEITGDNLAEGILLLNDDLLDLDRPVSVKFNGREVWKGTATRKIQTALSWIGQTGERTLFAPAEIRFTVPGGAAPAPAPPK